MDGIRGLHNNIEAYLKKFYLSKVAVGGAITVGSLGALWVVFSIVEYTYRLAPTPRAVLFYGFVIIAIGLIVLQVLVPLIQLLGGLRREGEEDAAKAIGKKIPEIDDRLSNALNLLGSSGASSPLTRASLDQRAVRLNVYDFSKAADFSDSLTWLKWTSIPLLVIFLIALWDVHILTDSSMRLVRYNQHFAAPAPFEFVVQNEELKAREGKPFELRVTTQGSVLPSHVFVEVEGSEFRMKNAGGGVFSYTFNNVRSDIPFTLRGASVYSRELTLELLEEPKIIASTAKLNYPDYTGMKDQELSNRSKLVVPEGSDIQWSLQLKDVEKPHVSASSNALQVDEPRPGGYVFGGTFSRTGRIKVELSAASGLQDSSFIDVEVVKDAYPRIEVRQRLDSAALLFYFNGELEDDYGLSSLRFVAEGADGRRISETPIRLMEGMVKQSFAHAWAADSVLVQPGQEVSYFFEVWDNDAINGAKKSATQRWSFAAPTKKELQDSQKKQLEETKSSLNKEEKEIDKLQKELDDARKKLLEKKQIDWEDKEALKELLDERQRMMEQLQKKADQQRQQLEKQQKFNPYSEELMQKQQMIQEMFDRLFDEEFKEKYKEYQELLDKMNKQQMLEKLDEMELDNEKLEKELDRTLELFKQLEFEQNLEDRISELDEMVQDQDALKEETEDKAKPREDLAKEQENLQERLEEFQESMDELEKLNEELEEPNDVPDVSEDADEAGEEMNDAKDALEKGNEKKAGESQQGAKEKMEEMKEKLEAFQQQMQQDQQTENLEHMRQLLENIVMLSKEQERVMEAIKPVRGNDPKYVELAKQQKNIMDDTKVVEDSLLALSKRVPQIDKVINDEIAEVKFNMEKALNNLTNQPPNQEQRYKAMAAERQQTAMTSLNNLALLFDDIMDNMQQQMSSSMKGSSQCQNPGKAGGSKPSAAEMRKMQENLNKRLERLKEMMEKGQNPNGKKPGQGQGMGMGSVSKEMAQMAAEQAAIRKQLREMSESLSEESGGQGGSAKDMKEIERMMEQTEEDILFEKISAQTLKRQQEILTKLLESEKAERERELDDQREAKTALGNYEVPQEVREEFERQKENEVELYRTVPPNLKPFYRNEVNRYFSNFLD